ncbi:sensor histidine kinase [Entomohabitans teleogrylli]|uniref:sensor histidine kinase n=1 Tax=Entomohabitans teleogrylli TaxID=1384589 RepID=UPI00073D9240|nr:sensor histidine kinase [Entomohabitans teleogrylli]
MKWRKPQSLFAQLLLFLGLPLALLWGLSAFNSYVSALQAATQAYDRTLLSSARTVAERLTAHNGHLEASVPWIVLDSFELNMNDRLYYKVLDPDGRVISGYDDLPAMPPATSRTTLYPALAWFYHTRYRGQAIRVTRLLQPVNEGGVFGMAEIYVAETLQSRRLLAWNLLFSSLFTQGVLVLLALILVAWLLRRVLTPMRQLSAIMVRRDPALLTPLPELLPWSETRLLIVAFNRYIDRLRGMIARQARFSADASHQLKTPLAVLKTQVSVALASDDPQRWRESLLGMRATLDNTIQVTERLLLLSRLRQPEPGDERRFTRCDLAAIARTCCFSRLAMARSKEIDHGYEGEQQAVWVPGDDVLLGELCANLLDNALKYTPHGGEVTIRVTCDAQQAVLEVEDSGPGIDAGMVHQALQPFHRLENAAAHSGAGLGLALVRDIAAWHDTRPELLKSAALGGLLVRVRFALAATAGPSASGSDGSRHLNHSFSDRQG